ncbi:hypothetical protein ACH5RR_032767 [Cinchona calisaya]|uniref:Uncharacterized protein n=1 Tax=Cinchona calisaya TaxID=153742 RepID=A0ABD2YN74_9GENT
MLTFRQHIVRGKKYLVTLNNENEPLLDGTMLPVYTSLYGVISDTRGALANPYYVKEWTMKLNSRQSEILSPYQLLSPLHSNSTSIDSFTTLAREILSGTTHWGSELKFGGEFSPIHGYWDQTMEILGRTEDTLVKVRIFNVVYASLYTYGCDKPVMRAFCKTWCHSTNTFHISEGEISISL